jgi:trigger factor
MQVSVEKITNVERRLTITVPANQVDEIYSKQIAKFAKTSKIKGFRPGKAPRSYIQKFYAEDIQKEALGEIIQISFFTALKEQHLNPVNTPHFEAKVLISNQPLQYTAQFEVLPEIETIQFRMESIEKIAADITDEDISFAVKQLSKQQTQWREINEAVKDTNRVVIDYYAIFEGKEDKENEIKNFPVEIGSKVMLPGFEEGLIGANPGDKRTLNLQFPADLPNTEKAGKPVDFVVEVKKVFAADVPALNEAFIKKLGIASGKEEELRQQIKTALELERDRIVKEKLKDQVFKQLIEQNPIDVPQSLISNEAKNIHDQIYQNHEHDHHQHSENELNEFNEIAKKRVALGILISEYAKKEKIVPDKAKIENRIQEIASVYENPQEVAKWLSTEERYKNIVSQVLEEQVLDKLIEGLPATIKQMNYAELKGIRI